MSQHRNPCSECLFRRDSVPGELGGSPIQVYVGQIEGTFWIPCHCARNYAGKQSLRVEVPECAGAAIFRSNTGKDRKANPALLKLPADHEKVFSSYEELWAHHEGVTEEQAGDLLAISSPNTLMLQELMNPNTQIV